ncbi:MAG: hypothetical protein AABY05_01240 [Nanoarchaeota archaeon]
MTNLAEELDLTPEIGYRGGNAISITTYHSIGDADVEGETYMEETIYRLTLKDEVTRAKYDDSRCTREWGTVMSQSDIDEYERSNQSGLQLSAVLGKPRSEVENYLRERSLTARHTDWFNFEAA